MRRFIANSVLLVMLGIFFAPALTAFTIPSIPMCCRRGGSHHCAMMAEMMRDEGTSLRASNPCPMREAPQVGSSIIALPVSRTLHCELARQGLIIATISFRQYALALLVRQRSPPALPS